MFDWLINNLSIEQIGTKHLWSLHEGVNKSCHYNRINKTRRGE